MLSSKKLKLSIALPNKLKEEFKVRVIQDGYGMRGKSKWVNEAVEEFLKIENFQNFVFLAEEQENLNDKEIIFANESLEAQINKGVIEVRKSYPLMEGVKSKILRAAIIQRLLRR